MLKVKKHILWLKLTGYSYQPLSYQLISINHPVLDRRADNNEHCQWRRADNNEHCQWKIHIRSEDLPSSRTVLSTITYSSVEKGIWSLLNNWGKVDEE